MERVIIHRENVRRFETEEDGYTGYVQYELEEEVIDLTHTIVPRQIEGRGIAASIVAYALEYAKEKGLKVRPTCSYIKAYIERHKDKLENNFI